MQPRFELEKVQMPPTAPHTVVKPLLFRTTRRAARTLARVFHFEVDAPLRRIQFYLGNLPRRLQPQRGGEEGFDRLVHGRSPRVGNEG